MKYINKSTLKSKMRRAGFRCEVSQGADLAFDLAAAIRAKGETE